MATKKKAAAKKAAAKKTAATKAPAKKPVAKKAAAAGKAAPPKKAAAKKAAAKKATPAKRPPAKKAPARKAPAAKKASPRVRGTTRSASGAALAPGYQLVSQLVTIDGVLNVELDGRLVPLHEALASGNVLAWSLSQAAEGGLTPAQAIEQVQQLLRFLEETQALQATLSITCCPG